MQYMLMFTESQNEFDQRTNPEKSPAYWGAWTVYTGELAQSGIMVSGAGLQPPDTATTVRIRDGKRQVHDGPYAESREMLGGFFVIDVPNLDVVLNWATRLNAMPALHQALEAAQTVVDAGHGFPDERLKLLLVEKAGKWEAGHTGQFV